MFYFVYLNPGGGGGRHDIKYNVCVINFIDFAVCQLQPYNIMYDVHSTTGDENVFIVRRRAAAAAAAAFTYMSITRQRANRTRRQIYLVWTARAGRAHCMTIGRPEGSNPKWLLLFGPHTHTHRRTRKWYNGKKRNSSSGVEQARRQRSFKKDVRPSPPKDTLPRPPTRFIPWFELSSSLSNDDLSRPAPP